MLDARPPLEFFVRGSILLVAILVVWRLVLVNPLLFLLRLSAKAALSLLSLFGIGWTVSGGLAAGWEFRFLLNDPAPGAINAITFTVPRSALLMFTFNMPAYWAIVLGARVQGQETARLLRSLIAGSAVVAVVELLLFATFLGIEVWRIKEQWHPSAGALSVWAHSLIEYLCAVCYSICRSHPNCHLHLPATARADVFEMNHMRSVLKEPYRCHTV